MKAALLLLLLLLGLAPPVLGSFGPNMNLANQLLLKVERDTVIAYLERCLIFAGASGAEIRTWITEIKSGATPELVSRTGR